MYIAGLNLAISPSRAIEALVVFSAIDYFRHIRNCMKTNAVQAESKGGRIRAGTTPVLGQIVTSVHALAFFVPPIVYIGALVFNKFRQPEWITRFALSDEIAGVRLGMVSKGVLRVGACIAGLGVKNLTSTVLYHLADQWHSLGRRERPRVVQTGPYGWVRHPAYTTVLLQEALWSIMFWSYAPVIALGIVAAAFSIKMPIEEAMIMQDEGIREQYKEYKRKVPARVIPYVW